MPLLLLKPSKKLAATGEGAGGTEGATGGFGSSAKILLGLEGVRGGPFATAGAETLLGALLVVGIALAGALVLAAVTFLMAA